MCRGLLFTGGRAPASRHVKRILREGDLVCAADSGFDTLRACGLTPDGVVGDMDSISNPDLLTICESVEKHPVDKDRTDTEIGIAWLRKQGCREIVLLGGGEGRLDHSLALIKLFNYPDAPGYWYTALEEIRLINGINGDVEIAGRKGDTLSVYPVGKEPWSLLSEGLVWELNQMDWEWNREKERKSHCDSMSLSNRMAIPRVKLSVRQGAFLLIRPLEEALRDY